MHQQFDRLCRNAPTFRMVAGMLREQGLDVTDAACSPGDPCSFRLGSANIGDPEKDDFEVMEFSLWLYPRSGSDAPPKLVVTLGFYDRVRDESPEVHIRCASGKWSIVSASERATNPRDARQSSLFNDLRSVLLVRSDEERALEENIALDAIRTMTEFFRKTKIAVDVAHAQN